MTEEEAAARRARIDAMFVPLSEIPALRAAHWRDCEMAWRDHYEKRFVASIFAQLTTRRQDDD